MAGAVSSGLAAANRLREQGHGTLVVLSSVAGERVRAENLVYGATKAGLDGFAQGLGDALQGTGARVMVVRPGFVHTRMTEGREPGAVRHHPRRRRRRDRQGPGQGGRRRVGPARSCATCSAPSATSPARSGARSPPAEAAPRSLTTMTTGPTARPPGADEPLGRRGRSESVAGGLVGPPGPEAVGQEPAGVRRPGCRRRCSTRPGRWPTPASPSPPSAWPLPGPTCSTTSPTARPTPATPPSGIRPIAAGVVPPGLATVVGVLTIAGRRGAQLPRRLAPGRRGRHLRAS